MDDYELVNQVGQVAELSFGTLLAGEGTDLD